MDFRNMYNYIDLHTAGEPFRLITEPVPDIPGATMEEKRRCAEEKLSGLRRMAMLEPRGHDNMYGGLLLPPVKPGSDTGVLFMMAEGMTTMCGHGMLCLARAAVELGLVGSGDGEHEFVVDAPAATVKTGVSISGGRVQSVSFTNDVSFPCGLDVPLKTREFGTTAADVAYGGAFMVLVKAAQLGLELSPGRLRELMGAAQCLRKAAMEQLDFAHPDDPERTLRRNGCCLILTEGPELCGQTLSTRTFTVFGENQFDRSPTGTGTSALAAVLYARGLLSPGYGLVNRGISGLPFRADIVPQGRGILPTISAQAYVTGKGVLILEDGDPLAEGFSAAENC